MPMLSLTRGCPYQCTFCSNPVVSGQALLHAHAGGHHPGDDALRVESYKATFFEFYDLTAIIRKDWLVNLCNLYLQRQS